MKSTLRILCLEDDEEDFAFINDTLEQSGLSVITKRVDSREKYVKALTEYNPDVILSDHALPKFNSTDALQLCLSMHLQVPFILVTGAVSDEFAVKCMKLGADDYILKSSLKRLPSAIQNALKLKETEKAKLKVVAELAAQNDELIKINKEVDSLVYSVSHNLRAPLMSMLGLINLAKKENNIENLHSYHQMMENMVHKLDDTLKEILDYSRNARQELQIERIDFKSLISETLEKMRFMPGFERLDIKVSVRDQVEFQTDYYRVSVIMNNLISNAVKYLDKNKQTPFLNITIIIDEDRALLWFQDNGIGIDHSLMPRIFDMFFRANTERDGSGLGLYIVKEAIQKLRGTIDIESELGEGTIFDIEIPNHLQDNIRLEQSSVIGSKFPGELA
jgi:signal transduction histidine kinase